jgi:threonine dehydratase
MLISIPDVPGSFQQLQNVIHPRTVTEFSYRFNEDQKDAFIYTSFSVVDRKKELSQVLKELNQLNFEAIDISQNEMAKSHGRYLVGGQANLPNERLYTFEFPEKPSALTNFLECLKGSWNLTLFHYRNHGSDIGKVLAGFDVPDADLPKFQQFLDDIGYVYADESDNMVYKKLLNSSK